MATTATRQRKPKEGAAQSGDKKARVSHAVPAMSKPVKVSKLAFKPSSKNTKYTEIVTGIRGLQPGDGVLFEPQNGEPVEDLKARISSLVSRNCSKHAPEGYKFRTRVTMDDEVCVSLVEKAADEDEGEE